MFREIFFFEMKYRLRKPGIYIYFIAAFSIAFLNFGFGALPLDEKQFINSPASFAFYVSMMSMVLMLASSAIMGVPLYRDIEYNTKEYYLSYPITKTGYFWGRYLASFILVLLLAVGLLLGAWMGSNAGLTWGWQEASRFGPNKFSYYLHPFLTLALPNLFFTSSLFFGLVAILRNIKVIYSSGIILLLGYLIANFFINSSSSPYVIFLSDPFAINGVKYVTQGLSLVDKNSRLFPIEGLLLINRLLWVGVGGGMLLYTWLRFSFEKFFSLAAEKKTVESDRNTINALPDVNVDFNSRYKRPVLFTLTRIEVINILRDNYFWIIIGAGSIFLGIIFTHGPGNYGVREYPRTSMILFLFNNNFMIFIFCVIIFYTGEVIHRERATRFAFINDSLPPPVWLFYLAKILGICCLAIFLCILPLAIGMLAQLSRGYYLFNFPVYFKVLFLCTLPKLVQMTMLSFMLHVCIRNKFAALGVGIAYGVLCMLAIASGIMNYRLLLFSMVPFYAISDFDNVGHMMRPVAWFNTYWLLLGGLFLLLGYLFYIRGAISSIKERIQLAKERFRGNTVLIAAIVLIAFILTAGFNYYNVSYLNHYYTQVEATEHQVAREMKLKQYETMPFPKVTSILMYADIFPEEQTTRFRTFVTIVNKSNKLIDNFLLDGSNLSEYSVKSANVLLPFTSPLFYPRGKFNLFGPRQDSSGYRLYQLIQPLNAGDTTRLEINSSLFLKGFANDLYGVNLLYNGVFMGLGLPGLGYNKDGELKNEEERKKYGLPKRAEQFPEEKEVEGTDMLLSGAAHDLIKFDITVSTSGDQIAIAPGNLEKQWKQNGRNYYRYTCNTPGIYTPPGIFSARYSELHDSVFVDSHYVNIDLYYHPTHNTNLGRFVTAYKDGLKYYSSAFGPYTFKQVRLAEAPVYAPTTSSLAATDVYTERFGWNADFKDADQFDYCYYITTRQLARQWWGNQVAPNHTRSSAVITEGLTKYCALVLYEKKYGINNMRKVLEDELNWYLWESRWYKANQHSLLDGGSGRITDNKAAIVLYGLKDLVGETAINAGLREFREAYAFKTQPPFAGARELYAYIKKHVPDSLQYYLTDTWEKVSFYDNRIIEAKALRLDNSNQYKVSIKFSTEKFYQTLSGDDVPAGKMNDYIDIAIFPDDSKRHGSTQIPPLYIQKHRLTAGDHNIDIVVTGKPVRVGIDPYLKLIDRTPADNVKGL